MRIEAIKELGVMAREASPDIDMLTTRLAGDNIKGSEAVATRDGARWKLTIRWWRPWGQLCVGSPTPKDWGAFYSGLGQPGRGEHLAIYQIIDGEQVIYANEAPPLTTGNWGVIDRISGEPIVYYLNTPYPDAQEKLKKATNATSAFAHEFKLWASSIGNV